MSSLEVPLNKSFRCVASPSVTGADLAEELFESILWYALRRYGFLLRIPSKEPAHLQAIPLQYITLRTSVQLKRLASLLDNVCQPLGRHPLAFTTSLTIWGEEADVHWIRQAATSLFPRLTRTGASNITPTSLTMHTAFLGLEPSRDQLRPLPSSFFLHITYLALTGASFKRTEDLLLSLSFFRTLSCVRLGTCSCSTVSAPAALLRFPLSTTLNSVYMDSERYFAAIFPSLFDVYVRRHALTLNHHDQEELRSLVNLTLLLYNNLSSAQWKNNSNVGLAYDVGVDVTTDDPSDSFYARGVFSLRLAFAEGLYTLFICAYPMQEKSYHDALWLDTWRKFAGHVTRLQHLNTVKFEFEYLFELEYFVITMRPILRSICRAGKAMAFDVYGEREWTSWEFETSVEFRRRFFYAHEAAPGKATTTAEDDAAEKFNMMISFSADDRNPGIAFPIYWKEHLE